MASKLRLVRGGERGSEATPPNTQSEEMFRYGAPEEVWEVSCEPDRDERPHPTLRHQTRRAS